MTAKQMIVKLWISGSQIMGNLIEQFFGSNGGDRKENISNVLI